MNRQQFLEQADPLMQLVAEQFDSVFSEEEPACLGCAAAAQRIRELEHQHKNDEAANQLLNEVCENQRLRIKEFEKCKSQESPSYPYC